jgi:hypothetical protein
MAKTTPGSSSTGLIERGHQPPSRRLRREEVWTSQAWGRSTVTCGERRTGVCRRKLSERLALATTVAFVGSEATDPHQAMLLRCALTT